MSESPDTRRYEVYGLHVDSEIALAGAPASAKDERPADMRIRRRGVRPVPDALPDGEVVALHGTEAHFHHAVIRTAPDTLVFRVPYVVDFELRGTNPIEVGVIPAADDQLGLIEVLAAGALFAVHFETNGIPVLHASAVTLDERAVAVVGHSGRGKSTTSALLCRAGHELVTDDLLRLWLEADRVACARGTTSLRLREKARALADAHVNDGAGDGGGPAPTSADGRLLVRPTVSSAAMLPLAALLFPHPVHGTDAAVTARRLSTSEAFDELLASPRFLGWEDPTILTNLFRSSGDLVQRLPAFEIKVPWDEHFSDDLAAELSRCVVDLLEGSDG